jgi:hypothetical protein
LGFEPIERQQFFVAVGIFSFSQKSFDFFFCFGNVNLDTGLTFALLDLGNKSQQ